MKKITILLMLLTISLMVFLQPVYAVTPPVVEEISDEMMWSRAATNGFYYVESDYILIDFNDVEMEFGASLGDWTQAFVAAAGDYNSVLEIYTSNELGTIVKTYFIAYEAPEVTEVLFLFDDEAPLDFSVDLTEYQDMYMKITLLLNPSPEPVSPSLVNNVEFHMNNYRDSYIFNIYTSRDVLVDQTIADLPLTTGNPYQAGQTGIVWDWAYNDTTNTFVAKVQYYSEYALEIPNVGFSAAGFLERVSSIDYYTIEGEKYFQFNFINNENVLLTGTGQFAKQWNGFALWNLTTNEFIMYNKALALTYIEVTPDREIFGYLYLPNIPVEDLIAVSGSFNYRYGYKNIFGTQKYEDWEKAIFVLEKDAESYGSQSMWEGAMPQWSYDVLAGSLAATAVGAILTMIPGLQPIGIPLLVAGVAGIVAANVGAINHAITGKTSEIQTATLTPQLRYSLNEHYTIASGYTTVLPTNAIIHKLYYGLFTKTATNVVEPDASTLVYTEITWATKGEVYTLDASVIDSEAVLDQDYLDSLPPEGEGSWLDDLFKDAPPWVIITLIFLAILFAAPTIDKGASSISNLFSNRRKGVIIIIIVLIFLLVTGIIRI